MSKIHRSRLAILRSHQESEFVVITMQGARSGWGSRSAWTVGLGFVFAVLLRTEPYAGQENVAEPKQQSVTAPGGVAVGGDIKNSTINFGLTPEQLKELTEAAEHVTAWLIPYDRKQDNPNIVYEGVRLKNATDQVIYDVIAEIVAVQGAGRKTAVGDSEERNREWGALVGNLPPGETTARIGTNGGGMHIRYAVELAFQDATGRFWLRHGNGLLEQVGKHPLDLYGISRPVSWEH
jgi:hypothetical protein